MLEKVMGLKFFSGVNSTNLALAFKAVKILDFSTLAF
jgi:hypothetical protein